jgi:hypothetical protein
MLRKHLNTCDRLLTGQQDSGGGRALRQLRLPVRGGRGRGAPARARGHLEQAAAAPLRGGDDALLLAPLALARGDHQLLRALLHLAVLHLGHGLDRLAVDGRERGRERDAKQYSQQAHSLDCEWGVSHVRTGRWDIRCRTSEPAVRTRSTSPCGCTGSRLTRRGSPGRGRTPPRGRRPGCRCRCARPRTGCSTASFGWPRSETGGRKIRGACELG